MKKIIAIAAGLALLCACHQTPGTKTPEKSAEIGFTCLQQKDYQGFVDLYDVTDDIKAGLILNLQQKYEPIFKEKGTPLAYEVESCTIEGEKAVMNVRYDFENNRKTYERITLTEKDGKWLRVFKY